MHLVTHLRAALPRLIASVTAFAIVLVSSPFAYGAMPENAKIYYYLHDHLGGIHKVLDEEGNVVEENDYLPFGEERVSVNSGQQEEDYGFTGKEKDEETGLNYYGARYYDGEIGRFTSPDPWEGDLKDPQTLNKYSYGRNNPLKYIDPTGEKIILVGRKLNFPFLGGVGTHTFLKIEPKHPEHFGGVESWTIGAYDGENGNLVKNINDPSDQNIPGDRLRKPHPIDKPEGVTTDTEHINKVMDAYSRYNNDRDYKTGGMNSCGEGGNCNNATTGFLEGSGTDRATINAINPKGINWGLGNPLPEMLDESRTDRAGWQKEFIKKAVIPNLIKKAKSKIKSWFKKKSKSKKEN